MNKINKIFTKGPAYIAYLTAGQVSLNSSLQAALALVAGGVDILEIGVPFSDPIADGPVIQQAMTNAIEHNVSIIEVLELVERIKQQTNIPIVLFTYYNPLLQFQHSIYKQAKAAGVDGILVVDLPLDESDQHVKFCKKFGIDPIFVITPTTSSERIKDINKQAQGFLYYACRAGTTGIKKTLPEDFAANIHRIKQNSNLPVAAGFGIASREVAKEVISQADGFVVGSRFVDAIANGITPAKLTQLTRAIDPRGVEQ